MPTKLIPIHECEDCPYFNLDNPSAECNAPDDATLCPLRGNGLVKIRVDADEYQYARRQKLKQRGKDE